MIKNYELGKKHRDEILKSFLHFDKVWPHSDHGMREALLECEPTNPKIKQRGEKSSFPSVNILDTVKTQLKT